MIEQLHLVDSETCNGDGLCVEVCPQGALELVDGITATVESRAEFCIGCGQCVASCHYGAARAKYDQSVELLNKMIAEYTLAVLQGKQHFHLNFIMNISPDCDCWNVNDQAIAPDVGIAASFDPVALDRASVDLVNAMPSIENSRVTDQGKLEAGEDKFIHVHPDIHWKDGLEHAEKLGVGTQTYKLVRIK